jgi:hypothetical protein
MPNATEFPNGVEENGQARRAGRQEVTGKATIATGLATVSATLAGLEAVNTGAKKGYLVTAKPSATAGAIDVVVLDKEGAEATAAAFVNWTASGKYPARVP